MVGEEETWFACSGRGGGGRSIASALADHLSGRVLRWLSAEVGGWVGMRVGAEVGGWVGGWVGEWVGGC